MLAMIKKNQLGGLCPLFPVNMIKTKGLLILACFVTRYLVIDA